MNGPHWWRIGDVATLLGTETHVIRYWESEFAWYLKPPRSKTGQRWYGREHIERLEEVKRLLYVERYTIEGAKRQLRLAAERERLAG